MAKSSTKKTGTNESSHSEGIRNAILIFPIIAIVGAVWLIMVKIEELPESLTFNQDFNTWLNLWILIFVISIVILVCIPQSGGSSSAQDIDFKYKPTGPSKLPKTEQAKVSSTVAIEADDKPIEFVPLAKDETKPISSPTGDIATITDTQKTDLPSATATPEIGDIKPADTIAKPAGSEKIKPKIVEYPLEVDGGLYGDTFIELGDETKLKLRTLVVKDIYLM
jgi:hypothetical protein